MGYMRHHGIFVSSDDSKLLKKAHETALKIFKTAEDGDDKIPALLVSPMSEEVGNSFRTFAIWPDGSKEGWPLSNAAEEARDKFVDWLEKQIDDDGVSLLRWVEVQFGDDENKVLIVRDSDERARSKSV